MYSRKFYSLLIFIALLAVMVLGGVAFARNPVHEPPHPGGHTPASLIVGVPFEDVGAVVNAGAIDVISAQPGLGLLDYTNVYYTQPGRVGKPEQDDFYGYVVAAGDFDGNGACDIAIGVPGEDSSVGAINVIYRFSGAAPLVEYYPEGDFISGAHAGDTFGSALVAADFNGDGLDDLAIGAPGYHDDDGAVITLFGTIEGFTSHAKAVFTGDDKSHSGAALARADFDANGIYDLVAGMPNANTSPTFYPNRSGKIRVFYGPLDAHFIRTENWSQSDTGQGVSETGDMFGYSLVTGDFNGDGRDDLAIGAPEEDTSQHQDIGAVNVLYNGGSGLSKTGAQVWFASNHQGDRAGFSLAAGDFDNDGSEDLAIGVPFFDHPSVANAGKVVILSGSNSGIKPGQFVFDPADDKIHNLGYSLVAGDFNGDAYDDLVIGVPGYSNAGLEWDGAIEVLYGKSNEFEDPVIMTQKELAHVVAEDYDYFGRSLAVLPPTHPARRWQFMPLIWR